MNTCRSPGTAPSVVVVVVVVAAHQAKTVSCKLQ